MPFEIINPITNSGYWNHIVGQFDEAGIFHSSEWAQVLAGAYNYGARYTVFSEGESFSALPLVEVDSPFTGRRGVSVPFADECRLLANLRSASCLPAPLVDLARASGWQYLEVRGAFEDMPGSFTSEIFFEHALSLRRSESEIREALRHSHRRNLRIAREANFQVRALETQDAMNEYYRLHCITRRRHGVPPQPRRFFRVLHEKIIARGHGTVFLATQNRKCVAGAVFLHFGRNAVFKFGASDPRYQSGRPNNLVMWEAIQYCKARGASRLSLGRTAPINSGLLQFKRGWGGEEAILTYTRIPVFDTAKRSQQCRRLASGIGPGICRHLPIPILRAIGAIVYPHLG